ncbi:putative Nitrite reductase (NAD(P)H) small subunit, NirD [Vibrio nigripulchritudo SO65]|uniref:nitrite reductase small subunit NirD n=1 Tax=Vibrio nigripulchritudo TaxID=28173 RepID=UPI0003B18007|nr:nitrite reductase small subunit NirD [Vibrio nigripulchritudo]CCN37896.1 putative Nitrite reductase (NAD(P)H) small subunit, NirD [Vibrio nigripulchritudo AM115]CCN41285.1 putative Nitrite reductase (NAD(P)H) small subunit, NirD [Vibrio nigripulchritudo FTn2]CCN64347.1 putative Nitrite reductase (NAD(P)H) small subunit, NirD [Vibrio nigripulchritudo POn4]CCN76918.1 putative Nitrite reductase (NAD(P)H) small subunit, NirD [Vibrio nigripulchritudo SO65]
MWKKVCDINQLAPYQGVGCVFDEQQVALFLVPGKEARVFAVGNWDPISKAYVMSRGIVGTQGDTVCVASPMYKQHFSLETGECLEEPEQCLKTWSVELKGQEVWLQSTTNE